MNIRINKEWVLASSGNAMNVVLAKIPLEKQEAEDIDAMKLSQKYFYSSIFGAINGLFKYGVIDSDAKSFLSLEGDIQRIAKACEDAFLKEAQQ